MSSSLLNLANHSIDDNRRGGQLRSIRIHRCHISNTIRCADCCHSVLSICISLILGPLDRVYF